MFKFLTLAAVAAIGSVSCIAVGAWGAQTAPAQFVKALTPAPPNINLVIQTSIQSINRQSKLVVLESRMSGVATASLSKMGMTAKQTDIQSAQVQYALNMGALSVADVHVSPEKIELVIPKALLTVNRFPAADRQTYNNDSWLFSLTDTGAAMTASNTAELNRSLGAQADALIPQAQAAAQASLTAIFSIPLQAAKVTTPVVVRFA